jgi:hypothetical protein
MKITRMVRRAASDPILVWSCVCHQHGVDDKVERQQSPDPFGSEDGTLQPNNESEEYRNESSNQD